MPIPLLCVLTACAASTEGKLAPPPSLTVACPAPVALPDRALTQAEVELSWGRDRSALRDCGDRLGALTLWQNIETYKTLGYSRENKGNLMPKAYSYIRMSTAQQLKGDSLRRQVEASNKYAEEHGLEIVSDFEMSDIGVSAFKGANVTDGALGRFLTAVDAGKIEVGSYLLVESLDRISRQDVWTAFGQLSSLMNKGIIVVTISDRQVYSKAAGPEMTYALYYAISVLIRANEESEMKSKRVGAAWQNKRKIGGSVKLTAKCPSWLTLSNDRKTFIVDEAKASIVREIFDMASNGKGGPWITRDLNLRGVLTISKAPVWSQTYVTWIIKNRNVIGEYQPCILKDGERVSSGEPIRDYYPAIIDEDVFNAIQVARKARVHHGGRKSTTTGNLFAHVAKCGYCGSSMKYYAKLGKQYYICLGAKMGAGCQNGRSIRYEPFERAFLKFVRDIDLHSLVSGVRKGDEIAAVRVAIEVGSDQVKSLKSKISAYLLRIEDQPSLEEFLTARMLELQAEAAQVADQVKANQTRLAALSKSIIEVSDDEIDNLITMFSMDGDGDRFMLSERIKSVVSRIDLFTVGKIEESAAIKMVESSGLPPDEIAKVVDALIETAKNGFASKPHFRVTLKDGDVQTVTPDPMDGSKIKVSVRGGKQRHIEFE